MNSMKKGEAKMDNLFRIGRMMRRKFGKRILKNEPCELRGAESGPQSFVRPMFGAIDAR